MNYSFTDYLNNRFYDEIMEAAEECLCADNVRGLSARITAVQIWQISTDVLLKYENYVEFPVMISARVRTEEDATPSAAMYICEDCSLVRSNCTLMTLKFHLLKSSVIRPNEHFRSFQTIFSRD